MIPSPWQRLSYLAGYKLAPPEHRAWLQNVVDLREARRSGVLLALPNAVLMAVVAVVLLVITDTTGFLIFIAGALLVLAVGAAVPSFARRRADRLIEKNGLSSTAQ